MQIKKSFLITSFIAILMIGAMLYIVTSSRPIPALANRLYGSGTAEARVPSTPNDFLLPGTQPKTIEHSLVAPNNCARCHADYSSVTSQPTETETWRTWQGSMMAQAGRDPLFYAALDVANADAADSGEFCLRCHLSRGWLEGRSSASDGSGMTPEDQEGVQCSLCHRMVDPIPSAENPAIDAQILAALTNPVSFIGSGSMIIDPQDHRRGPFDIVADLGDFDPHVAMGAEDTLVSPYHREAAFCGTCHDINNPMFTWDDASKAYQPNPLDEPGDPARGFPIERTYSEWKQSAFNSPQGVYAPQFGGNKQNVSTCQDCHMRDVTGAAGAFFGSLFVIRENMPLHDLTGANTWVPQIIPLHPIFGKIFADEPKRMTALNKGIERARYMLRNAADLAVVRDDHELIVTVQNHTGHKLPTGYVEGRRMWLQVEGYDSTGKMIFTSGAYNNATGELTGYRTDAKLKVYESEQGLTKNWADSIGLPEGPSFHFALNNQIINDNRIPPQGYTFKSFNDVQAAPYKDGEPDPSRYADGQFWDTTIYDLPDGVVRGVVRLMYQTASKEYIEFLRENNPNEGENNGEILYQLWKASGRSKPEIMAQKEFSLTTERQFMPVVQRP